MKSRLLIVCSFLTLPINCQDCYYPNGNLSKENDIPCSSTSGIACCPSGWLCLNNGLCYLDNAKYFGRYTCTDQSWKSPGCPNICTHSNTASGNEAILQCSQGNYCCDGNRSIVGCCDTGAVQFSLKDWNVGTSAQPVSASSSGSPSSPSSSSSSTSEPTLSSFSSAASSGSAAASFASTSAGNVLEGSSLEGTSSQYSSSISVSIVTSVVVSISGLTTATTVPVQRSHTPSPVIGPAVGVSVGVILFASLAFFFWRRRRNAQPSSPPQALNGKESMGYEKPELDSSTAIPGQAGRIGVPEAGELPRCKHMSYELPA